MATMKALRFEKYGPPSVLSVQELRVPDLKPKEARAEIRMSFRCLSRRHSSVPFLSDAEKRLGNSGK
jgi:hypothetical protein